MLCRIGHAMAAPASRGRSQFCIQGSPTLKCLLLRCLQVTAARSCWALADTLWWAFGAATPTQPYAVVQVRACYGCTSYILLPVRDWLLIEYLVLA